MRRQECEKTSNNIPKLQIWLQAATLQACSYARKYLIKAFVVNCVKLVADEFQHWLTVDGIVGTCPCDGYVAEPDEVHNTIL